MKLVVQYFCNLLMKKKWLTSYPTSTLIRLLAQIVYLIEHYFFQKNEIWKQLVELFNLSFLTGVFPSILKTAKVFPVFKKDTKLDYSNYCPITLLSNIEKILEKLMYKRLHTFLNKNVIFNLQFGFRQQHSTSHALKVVSATFLLVCFLHLKRALVKQGRMFFISPQKLFLFFR